MALTLLIESNAAVAELEAALHPILGEKKDKPAEGLAKSVFSNRLLWCSTGTIPDQPLPNFVSFRLNKDDSTTSRKLALACVREILETTTDDFQLTNDETVVLRRVNGEYSAYSKVDGFWDYYSIREALGFEIPLERREYQETDGIEASARNGEEAERISSSNIIGHHVAEHFRFDEWLAGDTSSGRLRGTAVGGPFEGSPVLLTTAANPRALEPGFLAELTFEGIPQISSQLAAAVVDTTVPKCVALIELEPIGTPLSESQLPIGEPNAALLGIELCEIASAAHAAGGVVRGFRPELIYTTNAQTRTGVVKVVGVAPRAFVFRAMGRANSYFTSPPFDSCYEPFEISRSPSAATDVAMIAGTLFFAASGLSPYEGKNWVVQSVRRQEGIVRPFPGSREMGELLAAALTFEVARRPSLADFSARLTSLV